MTSLPRNVLSKNKNIKTKYKSVREKIKIDNLIDNICLKHKIDKLTFRKCIYSTKIGNVTNIDYDFIKSNMRSGITIVKCIREEQVNSIYDVVELVNNKSKREKTENDIIQEELESLSNNIDQEKHANKYIRKFITEAKQKMELNKIDAKYLELRAETTDMIIDLISAYQIKTPVKCEYKYYIFIGYLEMKTPYMKRIDPTYLSEDIIKEQTEFYDNIQQEKI